MLAEDSPIHDVQQWDAAPLTNSFSIWEAPGTADDPLIKVDANGFKE
jgi:hypothetical protein